MNTTHIISSIVCAISLCAAAAPCNTKPCIESFGGTIMPYALNACDGDPARLAARLKTIRARSGISKFVLYGPTHIVRVTGMLDVAGYAAIGAKVKAVKDLLGGEGIDVGYLMMPTMNCGINHPWQKFVQAWGGTRDFTACPGEEGFRRDFAAKCRAVASSQPFAYVMEDDFRYFGTGCYCPMHLQRIGNAAGRKFTRETLLSALGEDSPDGAALRRRWHTMQTGDLTAIATAASEAIHEVSPDTRVVLCAPGGFPEFETEALARALAGPSHRPAVRWHGAIYGNDTPIEAAGLLFFAQWSRENIPVDIECLYESDPVPHSRFFASAARTGALVSSVMAMGFDEPYHWGLGSDPDALETTPDYLDLFARDSAFYRELGREARRGRSIGVCVHFDPRSRVEAIFLADKRRHYSPGAWMQVLNRIGIPATTHADAQVRLFSGHFAFAGLSDDETRALLSRPSVLDGAAAEALTMRGLGDLAGVEAYRRDKIDFSGERTCGAYGDGVRFKCSFHQNYGLDGCAVSRLETRGAEAVAVFYATDPASVVQPSFTLFTNRIGGRVAVMAVNLKGCVSPNVFSFAKRDLLARIFRDIGGENAVPARVLDRANVSLLANEDAESGRLLLHFANLSCDTAHSVLLEVGERHAGRPVEILRGSEWRKANAAWDGRRLLLRESVPVYGTMALRIHPETAPQRDLVVYGGTSAAISAAVQARRMGASVVVVSPDTRIGGLTTGGLGQTDIGHKEAFGGIAIEFYRDIARWYADPAHWTRQTAAEYRPDGQCAGTKGIDSMWTFEPSAALAVLEGWVRRDGIEVVRGERLDRSPGGVAVKDGRIVSFRTESGKVYRAKCFIDATYEGDLMAAAGVSYTVGRESNSEYGETLNGSQPRQGWHKFVNGVDPYVVKGDPSSGLLPGIDPSPVAADGTGDRRVQAYCFRMCLTDDEENRIPFKKPEGYEERNYELLIRNYEAGEKHVPWINSKMPNRKTDTNNSLGFSSDFIGQNHSYPDASYEERERIVRAHLDYQRGLMWTLAYHPRMPESIRRAVSRWGTCRDEFVDGFGDGWQRQLYVREARRMRGDYVMTEANCRGKRIAQRPVGMAAYGMDSHHVRRYVDADGHVQNEGDVEVGCPGPYPIDYGSITPRRDECANLLVPICVSASHIAYGSIRMEPVFFSLGQAAGAAAALAARAGSSVQNVPYDSLAEVLKSAGCPLCSSKPHP